MTELNDPGTDPAFIESASGIDDALGDNLLPAESIAIAGDPQTMALRDDTLGARMAAIAAVTAHQLEALVRVPQSAIARGKSAWSWIHHNERPLSAFGMVAGFGFDNVTYRRIDLPNTHILFIAYLAAAASSIALLHFLARRAHDGKPMPRWHSLLPVVTQFALGCLWSAFLVFYSRGSVLTTSWPFLAVLAGILIGNEFLKGYHSKLVFTTTLFFFALYSYCIVTLPILAGTIGTLTFVGSGIAALLLFSLFVRLIGKIGGESWNGARWWIALGALCVFAVLNLFYFTDVLPPLPLALAGGGVYHTVAKKGQGYVAETEPQSWTVRLGAPPVMHVAAGQSVSVYSAVFAPIRLATSITHRWQRYDPKRGKWLTMSRVTYAIHGGRDGGFRGYTVHRNAEPGEWRVDVDTIDGRTIGRIRFNVERVPQPIQTTPEKLG
ncbi:MAG TPA: DUF2914 domain-containing protein [Rhizomicrobium sp.]|nr:DUF2914 domain-containing protein [Rhizomicrobium sp.]